MARVSGPGEGALLRFSDCGDIVEMLEQHMTTTTARHSPQVSVRLDPALVAVIEREASAERRTISNLLRNVISDWAAARAADGQQAA